jgi:hypothetical protein
MDRRKLLIGISTVGVGIAGYIFNPLNTPQQPPSNETIVLNSTDERIETEGYTINPRTLLLSSEDLEEELLPAQRVKTKVNDEIAFLQDEEEQNGVKASVKHESRNNDLYLNQEILVFNNKFTAQEYMTVYQNHITGESSHSYINRSESTVFNSNIGDESYIGIQENQENHVQMVFNRRNICVLIEYKNSSTGDLSVNEDISAEELVNSIKEYASMINEKINNQINTTS